VKQDVGGDKAPHSNGPNERLRRDLRQVFSRGQDETYDGLSQGFLAGVKHQSLVRGRSPRHRGNFVGRVQSITKKGIAVKVEPGAGIKRGDGVVFDRNLPEEKEEGGSVYEIFDGSGKSVGIGIDNEVQGGIYTIAFATNAIDFSRIKKGDIVWRSKDPSLENRLKSYVNKVDLQTVPVSVFISGKIGECLLIRIVDREGKEGIGHSDSVLQAASNRPLTACDLEKSIGLLGDTPFRIIAELDKTAIDASALEDGLFLPNAEIKAARRKAVDHLIRTRREHSRAVGLKTDVESCLPDLDDLDSEWDEILTKVPDSSSVDSQADFYILCRNLNQVRAACKVPWLKEIALDFLEVHGLR
jgi:U32 family peptidase